MAAPAQPGSPGAARSGLIRLQKRLVKGVKAEIKELLGGVSAELEHYYEEYRRDLRSYERPASKRELVERVMAADIVLNGDYHSLKQSQKVPMRILQELLGSKRPITLAVEAVPARHQEDLDDFLAGEAGEEEFLRRIDYDGTWGFPWANYRPLFQFARERGLRMLAINSQPEGSGVLDQRDRAVAGILLKETLARPKALLYVMEGDLHIAQAHLPGRLRESLADAGQRREILTVYLNSETIYWDLAEKGLDQSVDCVRLDASRYCVMNSTPLVKYQSYLHWVRKLEELPHQGHAAWEEGAGAGPDAEVRRFVHAIAGLLEIRRDDLDDFETYTTGDLDFLGRLQRDASFSLGELKEIETQILKNESYFVTKGNIIYLATLSLNHAAEEAAHFVHGLCAGTRQPPSAPRDAFYYRVMREALGFLGSRIVNPKRTCYEEADFRETLGQMRGRRRLGGRERELKAISELALGHLDGERKAARGARFSPGSRALYRQAAGVHIGLCHALGYILGSRAHQAMLQGVLGKGEVRALFHEPFTEPGRAQALYLDLSRKVRRAPGTARGSSEHL